MLFAAGCADYVYAPPLEPEVARRVGMIDVTPSGQMWVLEPYFEPLAALRRYDGDRVVETVPCPEVITFSVASVLGGAPALRALADDRLTVMLHNPTPSELHVWDGVAWTRINGPSLETYVSFPPIAGPDGSLVIGFTSGLRFLAPDGEQRSEGYPLPLTSADSAVFVGDTLMIAGYDPVAERTRLVARAADGTASPVATAAVDLARPEVARLGDRAVWLDESNYVASVYELDGTQIARLTEGYLKAWTTASDGALYLMIEDFLWARLLIARLSDGDGLEYVGEIDLDRTRRFEEASHLAPDAEGGVFVYGAAVHHVVRP